MKKPRSSKKMGKSPAGAGRAEKVAAASDASARPVGAQADPASLARMQGNGQTARQRFHTGLRTGAFRLAFTAFLSGVLIVAASLVIPHDFAFFELGYLFTLSIYDLVLAMLGLSVAIGMAEKRSDAIAILATFLGVVAPMLLFFDPIFQAILQSPLGHELFLIAPIAVMLAGLVLWLPGRIRRIAAPVAAAVVGFSLSLFIGLDDFGIGIKEFAFSAVLGAVWILAVPGLMLRPFRGRWLVIPARIIGSWLMVIGVIVTVSLYVPFTPDAPPLVDPSLPDGGVTLDAPSLPPLDPAIEEGLVPAPDGFGTSPDQDSLPAPELGDNPLLGGSRDSQP